MSITVVGGGLAGCECAWQAARLGIPVHLIEMKPHKYSPAHSSENLGELVCSNSFRSALLTSGPGLLKEELRALGSLIMAAADETAAPAGKALAVDRGLFAGLITRRITKHPLITLERRELTQLPSADQGAVVVATGPLTSDAFARAITELFGAKGLSFYDAIAPIVAADSLDMSVIFEASRYSDGPGDYLNCPMDKELYYRFVAELVAAKKMDPHPFENIPHFEGCLPVEELAHRGPDTLAFGPMKPVGLIDPRTGRRSYAVVQLRPENREKTLYNLVGFQTKMTYPEQERVFRMIPGLEAANFVRLGSVHRNTYLNSPELLDEFSRAKKTPHLFFAGQITGVEGYIESTASGLVVGLYAALLAKGKTPPIPPATTAVGALMKHALTPPLKKFVPMNINFGIMDPPPAGIHKKARKEYMAERGLKDLHTWIGEVNSLTDE